MIGFMGFGIVDLGLMLMVAAALLAGFALGLYPRIFRSDDPFLLSDEDRRRETLITAAAGSIAICMAILNILLRGVFSEFWIWALLLGLAYLLMEFLHQLRVIATRASLNRTFDDFLYFISDLLRHW